MESKLQSIYEHLFTRYGELNWWPAKTPYEVMVGAILTQNTAWGNVEKAIANFGSNLSPELIREINLEDLMELIRPAGFFKQKSVYLKAVTTWFGKYDFDIPTVQREPLLQLRKELLGIKGVGRETADAILLYVFELPSFVIDAYTMRLCERYPVEAGENYEAVKVYFEKNLEGRTELYNNFHAMIDINAKEHCRKKNPKCETCPLVGECKRRGVL